MPEASLPIVVSSLLSIAKSTRAYVSVLLAEIDLHPGQDQLIDKLDVSKPISVSFLAEQLCVRPSTVSKMLDRLVVKGLVCRSQNAEDGRLTMVHLTPAGEETKAKARRIWNELEEDLKASVEPERLEVLAQSLAQTERILRQKLARFR